MTTNNIPNRALVDLARDGLTTLYDGSIAARAKLYETTVSIDGTSADSFGRVKTSYSGGFDMGCLLIPSSTNQNKSSESQIVHMKLPVTLDPITGVPIPILIAAIRLGGTSLVKATLNWREIR
jgi:hypothetical protein